jgi:PHD/YefM family antitoxin component YafN of YafNO toxin-antitoxin module
MLLPDTTTYSEFRENLSSHFKRLKRSPKPTMITQNGKTAAVVMAPEAYERLVNDAEQARSIARLRRAQRSARAGKGRSVADVFADLYAGVDRKPRARGGRRRR